MSKSINFSSTSQIKYDNESDRGTSSSSLHSSNTFNKAHEIIIEQIRGMLAKDDIEGAKYEAAKIDRKDVSLRSQVYYSMVEYYLSLGVSKSPKAGKRLKYIQDEALHQKATRAVVHALKANGMLRLANYYAEKLKDEAEDLSQKEVEVLIPDPVQSPISAYSLKACQKAIYRKDYALAEQIILGIRDESEKIDALKCLLNTYLAHSLFAEARALLFAIPAQYEPLRSECFDLLVKCLTFSVGSEPDKDCVRAGQLLKEIKNPEMKLNAIANVVDILIRYHRFHLGGYYLLQVEDEKIQKELVEIYNKELQAVRDAGEEVNISRKKRLIALLNPSAEVESGKADDLPPSDADPKVSNPKRSGFQTLFKRLVNENWEQAFAVAQKQPPKYREIACDILTEKAKEMGVTFVDRVKALDPNEKYRSLYFFSITEEALRAGDYKRVIAALPYILNDFRAQNWVRERLVDHLISKELWNEAVEQLGHFDPTSTEYSRSLTSFIKARLNRGLPVDEALLAQLPAERVFNLIQKLDIFSHAPFIVSLLENSLQTHPKLLVKAFESITHQIKNRRERPAASELYIDLALSLTDQGSRLNSYARESLTTGLVSDALDQGLTQKAWALLPRIDSLKSRAYGGVAILLHELEEREEVDPLPYRVLMESLSKDDEGEIIQTLIQNEQFDALFTMTRHYQGLQLATLYFTLLKEGKGEGLKAFFKRHQIDLDDFEAHEGDLDACLLKFDVHFGCHIAVLLEQFAKNSEDFKQNIERDLSKAMGTRVDQVFAQMLITMVLCIKWGVSSVDAAVFKRGEEINSQLNLRFIENDLDEGKIEEAFLRLYEIKTQKTLAEAASKIFIAEKKQKGSADLMRYAEMLKHMSPETKTNFIDALIQLGDRESALACLCLSDNSSVVGLALEIDPDLLFSSIKEIPADVHYIFIIDLIKTHLIKNPELFAEAIEYLFVSLDGINDEKVCQTLASFAVELVAQHKSLLPPGLSDNLLGCALDQYFDDERFDEAIALLDLYQSLSNRALAAVEILFEEIAAERSPSIDRYLEPLSHLTEGDRKQLIQDLVAKGAYKPLMACLKNSGERCFALYQLFKANLPEGIGHFLDAFSVDQKSYNELVGSLFDEFLENTFSAPGEVVETYLEGSDQSGNESSDDEESETSSIEEFSHHTNSYFGESSHSSDVTEVSFVNSSFAEWASTMLSEAEESALFEGYEDFDFKPTLTALAEWLLDESCKAEPGVKCIVGSLKERLALFAANVSYKEGSFESAFKYAVMAEVSEESTRITAMSLYFCELDPTPYLSRLLNADAEHADAVLSSLRDLRKYEEMWRFSSKLTQPLARQKCIKKTINHLQDNDQMETLLTLLVGQYDNAIAAQTSGLWLLNEEIDPLLLFFQKTSQGRAYDVVVTEFLTEFCSYCSPSVLEKLKLGPVAEEGERLFSFEDDPLRSALESYEQIEDSILKKVLTLCRALIVQKRGAPEISLSDQLSDQLVRFAVPACFELKLPHAALSMLVGAPVKYSVQIIEAIARKVANKYHFNVEAVNAYCITDQTLSVIDTLYQKKEYDDLFLFLEHHTYEADLYIHLIKKMGRKDSQPYGASIHFFVKWLYNNWRRDKLPQIIQRLQLDKKYYPLLVSELFRQKDYALGLGYLKEIKKCDDNLVFINALVRDYSTIEKVHFEALSSLQKEWSDYLSPEAFKARRKARKAIAPKGRDA